MEKIKNFFVAPNAFMKFLKFLFVSSAFYLVIMSQYSYAEDKSLYLYVSTPSPVYKFSEEVDFRSRLRVGTNKYINKNQSVIIQNSQLVIKDLSGNPIYSKTNAFHHNDEEYEVNVGHGFSGIASGFLKNLTPGEYTAVWEVDGYASNIEKFKIEPQLSIEDLPALVIKPLGKRVGFYGEPLFITYFVNKEEAVNMYNAMVNSKLWIDGIVHERDKTYLYDYGTEFQSYEFWSEFTDARDYYDIAEESGLHEVQLEFSGEKSNIVKIRW